MASPSRPSGRAASGRRTAPQSRTGSQTPMIFGGLAVVVVPDGGAPARVDAVINSHSHEHLRPGNWLFTDARDHLHVADLPGVRFLEGLMDVSGLEGEISVKQEDSDEVDATLADTTRCQRILGFVPTTDLTALLERQIQAIAPLAAMAAT